MGLTDDLTGGCRCGAVRYKLSVDKMPPAYCCHCLDCQKSTGSAFAEQLIVAKGALSHSGNPVEFVNHRPDGGTTTHFICGQCQSRLWSHSTSRPTIILVRGGSLDTSPTIEPRLHIWTKRKQPWIGIADHIPVFDENAPAEAFVAILSGKAPPAREGAARQ
jgi:hypothetical protein